MATPSTNDLSPRGLRGSDNWSRAGSGDEAFAFSAYVAAVDREQLAEATYRRLIAEIEQM
jgi:hypothetical protein